MTANKVKRLVKRVDGQKGISQRKLAKRFRISQSYVNKQIKNNGINYYKRQLKPKVDEKQKIVIKSV